MCPGVVRLRPEMALDEAVQSLSAYDCSGAPVVAGDGRLIGILSEESLLDVLFDISSRHWPVSDFMTTSVHVVEPDDSLEHAAHMFEVYGIRRLPVVEDGQLVGILTRHDLIRHVLDRGESLDNPLETLLPNLAELQANAM
jgi:tRNA nucleotidyltransferase (CCA-adding enzyme)